MTLARMGILVAAAVPGIVAHRTLQQDCTGQGVTWGPGLGQPPDGCDDTGGGGGGGGGGRGGGGDGASDGSCGMPPCPAAELGTIGTVSVTGTDDRTGISFEIGEDIYGPFEAGFAAQQDGILMGLGCTEGLGYVDGGIDTHTAEQIVATACGITLPRLEGSKYISLLDECGGHTQEYHFHERLSCLYEETGGHSAQVGIGPDDRHILYGKWLDADSQTLPKLDACGGRFGFTPESPDKIVYHYQVQDRAPFTFGCFGPILDDPTGNQKLVSLEECRALYDGCGDGDIATVTTTEKGTFEYDLWCPCYDAEGSNVGNAELAAFAEGENIYGPPASEYPTSGQAADPGTSSNPEGATETPDDSQFSAASKSTPSLFALFCTLALVRNHQ